MWNANLFRDYFFGWRAIGLFAERFLFKVMFVNMIYLFTLNRK